MIAAVSSALAMLAVALAPSPAPPPPEVSGGPYCGVYCVYAAARMHGREVAFNELLQQQYVGSYKGSTIGELQRGVADLGLTATPMTGLTPASLRSSAHPVLLHVRRPGKKMPYAHWVLFAGVEDGQARVIDPPGGVELVPFAELAALWDGVGLVVSPAALSPGELRTGAWAEAGVLLAGAAVALVALRLATAGRKLHPVCAACAVVGVGVAVGFGAQFADADGLYRNRTAVGLVAHQHFQPDIPEIGIAEMRALVGRPDVTIVDARIPADYAYAHIPGALSLPVYAGLTERRAVSAALPRRGPVVVYCQSQGCVWADAVAADLYHRGHPDIRIFRGGWRGWAGDE